MKASYLGAMGYAQRSNFPTTLPIPPIYHDPATSVRSYQEGIEECELAEEMGFLGVFFTLGLYLFWLWRMLETAQLARDRVGAFLCAAIAAGFAFQVVYNSAMVAGLVPVKGLPLPLMSSGGSSVLASLISVGLVLNVRMRRFAN